MQLTIKTLKGDKFVIQSDTSNTVAQVKTIIEAEKSDLPAENMKLIHSGKVLKDEDTIESCQIKPNDFLVVMITKTKKAATTTTTTNTAVASTSSSAAIPTATSTREIVAPTTASSTLGTVTDAVPASTATVNTTTSSSFVSTNPVQTVPSSESISSQPSVRSAAVTASTAAVPIPAPTAVPTPDEFPADLVSNLTAMGFPEPEVRACLRASQGNPDIAVEFLMNGIPPGIASLVHPNQNLSESRTGTTTTATVPVPSSSTSSSTTPTLQELRNHPQINQLRRLIQSNPQMLQAVLTQIAQQQPELLREINANQAAFLEIMNEPITEDVTPTVDTPATSAVSSSFPSSTSTPASSSTNRLSATAASMMGGLTNPNQMIQALQGMSPAEIQAMAATLGLSPEQLASTAQMIQSMPPEALEQYMRMAMMHGGMGGNIGSGGGFGDDFDGGDNFGGMGGAPQIVRLTEEEMAAVRRLADMGFDTNLAAQAYLACDKNEALAANLLMDGGFGFDDQDFGGGGGGGDYGDDDDAHGDDMYD